jgi:hypothetical protein
LLLKSAAVPVTVVVPTLNVLPDAGEETTVALQLSVAVVVNVTAALQFPVVAVCVIADGQLITGAWLSVTVTVNEQVDVLPLPSVAVLVTVCVPTVNELPEAGLETVDDTEQLSVAVEVKVTTAEQRPPAAFTLIPFEQVTTGAV